MKLIHKTTGKIINIDAKKLSGYSRDYLIVDESKLQAIDDPDGSKVVVIPEQKHIVELKSVEKVKGYDKVQIVEMDDDAKLQLQIEEDENKAKELSDLEFTHKGTIYKYILICNIAISEELLPNGDSNPYYRLYNIGLIEDNGRELIYDENGDPIKIVSYWHEIKPKMLAVVSNSDILVDPTDPDRGNMFELKINDNYVDKSTDSNN